MFTAWLRKVFGTTLDSVAAVLARLGLTANAVTLIGGALNIGVGLLVAFGYLRIGGLLLILASVIDGLDGALARKLGKPTKFGAFLDSVLDRVSESAILLGLAWWYMAQPGRTGEILAYVTIVGSMLVSYTRARAEGVGIACKVGLFTRVERCIVLIIGLVFRVTTPVLWILAVGTVLTAAHRVIDVYSKARNVPLET